MPDLQDKLERDLLSTFPKRRPRLAEPYEAIYLDHYRMNRSGNSPATSVARKMESWMHRRVAQDIPRLAQGYKTLEIGAGSLNHLEYERESGDYDVVEPFVELFENSPYRSRVGRTYHDIQDIEDARYERIISIAAFEHLCDLPRVVAKCGLLLKSNGSLRVSIPSEGELLWGLGWRFTTGIEFRLRHGLDYGTLMRHEHVNTAHEIAAVLRVFFKVVRRSLFGLSPMLSFYQFFECADPNPGKCLDYLNRDFTR